MNINDKMHGFVVTRIVDIPDVSGKLFEMVHEGSGASLIFLERDDDNKTFAIGFRTLPSDDTGVFHILEHSVLCGSDKYPVKEPFVELLKGSQNTFLNAMTYEDRTVYPVSSRNPKDFLNLVSVYMDAVLHPTALKDSRIFRQEGWHFELDEEENLIYNGVVYNEMKGAYSSPDEISVATAKATLFPNTPYKYESGGAPKAIPDLTFEEFCASHARFYHPSNAMMFLDGRIDIDATLSLLDDFLRDYTPIAKTEDIAPQEAVDGGVATAYYEISENEDPEGKCRLSLNYVYGSPEDGKLVLATNILIDALLGSNDAPLKKAILKSGLAEDFDTFTNRTVQQSLQMEARGVKEENLEALEELILTSIKKIAEDGIDKNAISSALNAIEFKLREKDYGSFPKGVAFALSVFGATNYGRSPEAALSYEADVKAIREAIDTNYFEETLLAMTVNNPHRSKVILLPDKEMGKKISAEEKERLAKIKASMTSEELAAIKAEAEALKAWQASVDTEENLAKLPTLGIEDIYVSDVVTPTDVHKIAGTEVINHPIDTSGIGYYKLLFKASDLECEEIFALNILSVLFGNVKTDKHTPLEVQNLIKANLGGLSFGLTMAGKGDDVRPYLVVSGSSLDSKKEDLRSILTEVLLTSDLGDKEALKNLLMQSKLMAEDMFSQSGHAVAIGRVNASLYKDGVIKEYISGYESYKLLCGLIDNYDSQIDGFIDKICRLHKKAVTQERLTISITGALDEDFTSSLINDLPKDGITPEKADIKPLGFKSEAIIVPSRVSYAVAGADAGNDASDLIGALMVSRSILSYEYLWNQIRVLGGAYGAGFMARRHGFIGCYSYRDPSPINSIEKYKECGSFLGNISSSDMDLTKFIIGAIGEYDSLTTPRLSGSKATADYLSGWTPEDDAKVLADMKSTDKETLMKVAELLTSALSNAVTCVVGSREHIEANKDSFDSIIEI